MLVQRGVFLGATEPSRNLPELHLILIEPRDREHAALAVDADVGGRADRRYNLAHLAVAYSVDRRVSPARDEDAAVAEDLDAVVLARAIGDLRRRLARRPGLHVLAGERREHEAAVRRVPGDAVRIR